MPRLLLVGEDAEWLDIVALLLADQELRIITALSAAEALARLTGEDFALVICGRKMSGLSGPELVMQSRVLGKEMPFLLIDGRGETLRAVEILRFGTQDISSQPYNAEDIPALAALALEHGRLHRALTRAALESGHRRFSPEPDKKGTPGGKAGRRD